MVQIMYDEEMRGRYKTTEDFRQIKREMGNNEQMMDVK
jgi:hypothetical protein